MAGAGAEVRMCDFLPSAIPEESGIFVDLENLFSAPGDEVVDEMRDAMHNCAPWYVGPMHLVQSRNFRRLDQLIRPPRPPVVFLFPRNAAAASPSFAYYSQVYSIRAPSTEQATPGCLEEFSADGDWPDFIGQPQTIQQLRTFLQTACVPRNGKTLLGRMGVSLGETAGILISGASGSGKSLLCSIIAARLSGIFACYRLLITKMLSSSFGESEERLRSVFSYLRQLGKPCALFLDNGLLDEVSLANTTDADGSGVEQRLLLTLLAEMDGIQGDAAGPLRLLVVGTADNAESLPSAISRPGRFGKAFNLSPYLTESESRLLFFQLLGKVSLAEGFSIDAAFDHIAQSGGLSAVALKLKISLAVDRAISESCSQLESRHFIF